MNHLSWAAALGAPTGLLALQGDDELGNTIREKLTDINVSIEHIKYGNEFATSVSHILLDKDGERASLWLLPQQAKSLIPCSKNISRARWKINAQLQRLKSRNYHYLGSENARHSEPCRGVIFLGC